MNFRSYSLEAKKTTKKKGHSSFYRYILLLAAALSLCAIVTAFLFYKNEQAKQTTLENPKIEMKVLPPKIKKELQYASSSATFRVPIFLYHYVEYVQDKRDTIRQSLTINPFTFENQIQTLLTSGYTFMTVSELSDVLGGKRKLPNRPIIFTFDDGYRDFYTDVFPIVKKYNIKVTAYIVPGFIGKLNYMFMPQLDEVAKSGVVEIGTHTMHHYYLKGRIKETVSYEVLESKRLLEEWLHIPVVSFAYPYGAFDDQTIDIVKNAHFTAAVSTVPGIEASEKNRFFLYRLRPGGRSGNELLRFLQQSKFSPW